jgi:hypothetical protein
MFEDLRDYLSTLCFWRLPTTEATITGIETDQVRGNVLIYYRFSVGDDGPYTGVHIAEGLPLPGVKYLNVGQTITVRYRQDDPSVNMPDRDLSLTNDL